MNDKSAAPYRDMTAAEVGIFVAYLERLAALHWKHYAEASSAMATYAGAFKLEAKTYDEVLQGFLKILEGRDPKTGERWGENENESGRA